MSRKIQISLRYLVADRFETGHELAGLQRFRNQLRTCYVEIARTCSKLVADRFQDKFHYAVWSQTGPKLVADVSQTC